MLIGVVFKKFEKQFSTYAVMFEIALRRKSSDINGIWGRTCGSPFGEVGNFGRELLLA